MMTKFDVERFSRIPLGHTPTPLEPLERLSAELGLRVWVKRDDCTGLALGGNKVRKLEFLLGEALAAGADTVVTVGGVQSNHARQTAAAAARLGLRCELVLPRLVDRQNDPYERSGNVLLDRLLGAHVHIVEDAQEAAGRIGQLLEQAEKNGRQAAFFPSGGSTATGALGYVRAASEFVDQAQAQGLRSARIFVATSTGGTLAGLLTGLADDCEAFSLTGVAVYDDAATTRGRTTELVEQTTAKLGVGTNGADQFDIDGRQLGDGYGIPTAAMREALELCARLEGLVLDPVYTGKAMAALVAFARSQEATPEEDLVFWHTGGAPALFAYDSD